MSNRMNEYFRYRRLVYGINNGVCDGAGLQPVRGNRHRPAVSAAPFVWQGGVLDGMANLSFMAGEFESKLTERDLATGDLLLVFKVWHRYRPVSETGWEVYWYTSRANTPSGSNTTNSLCPKSVLKVGLDDTICIPSATVGSAARGASRLPANDRRRHYRISRPHWAPPTRRWAIMLDRSAGQGFAGRETSRRRRWKT